jgi:hypothetical protein
MHGFIDRFWAHIFDLVPSYFRLIKPVFMMTFLMNPVHTLTAWANWILQYFTNHVNMVMWLAEFEISVN